MSASLLAATAAPAVADPVEPSAQATERTVAVSLLAAESAQDVEDYSGYSWRYYFAMTRGVSRSTLVTPLKPPLFLLTIPIDIVLLPFSAIGGFF